MSLPRVAAVVIVVLVGCSGSGPEERARSYAAGVLHGPEAGLRVTARSDLATPRHAVYFVTRDEIAPLTVIVPPQGDPFDLGTEGAFDRVARAEDATRRSSQLGAERIALWYAALDARACGMPDINQAHFARAEKRDGGLRVTYLFATGTGARRCILELADDGALRSASAEDELASAQAAAGRWASDRAR